MEALPLSQIPQTLIESASQDIRNFSIGFIRLDEARSGPDAVLLGSGTLVMLKDKHAILTAHHVVKALPREGRLGFILSPKLHQSTIAVEGLQYLEIDRGSVDSYGPDLGAVILSPTVAGTLGSLKSFYNLALRRSWLLNEPPHVNEGIWFVHGFVAEWTIEEGAARGFEKVKGFYGLAGLGSVESPYSVGKHDYFTFRVSYGGPSVAPGNFGGMSRRFVASTNRHK